MAVKWPSPPSRGHLRMGGCGHLVAVTRPGRCWPIKTEKVKKANISLVVLTGGKVCNEAAHFVRCTSLEDAKPEG